MENIRIDNEFEKIARKLEGKKIRSPKDAEEVFCLAAKGLTKPPNIWQKHNFGKILPSNF